MIVEIAEDDVLIELDGPNVHPDTVDTQVLLRLAEAYFRLLGKVSEAKKIGVTLVGLSVVDKCAAVMSRSSNGAGARLLTDYAIQIVDGSELAPYGTEMAANDVRASLRGLPAGYQAKARAGSWERPLRLADERLRQFGWEEVELRVRVVKVGGVRPRAHFDSDSEAAPFVLSLSEDDAMELGKRLYQTVDIEARLVRDHSGEIEDGEVIAVHLLSDEDPKEAWRSWFRRAGRRWGGVTDVLKELGRDD
jgi:hypothetical protein